METPTTFFNTNGMLTDKNYVDPKSIFNVLFQLRRKKNHKIAEKIVINKFPVCRYLIFIVYIIFSGCIKMKIKWDAKWSLPKLKPQSRFNTTYVRENESLH